MVKDKLLPQEAEELLRMLQMRLEKHVARHEGITWNYVSARLAANPEKLLPLYAMEATGGEPDVVACDSTTGELIFYDCSAESPKERRSLCYDREALDKRKENKPKGNVIDTAAAMGIELLTEVQYRYLQQLGNFDTKTSTWVHTPASIRKHGGAIFCDRRYDTVFTYHNGAESYYGARGFRGALKV